MMKSSNYYDWQESFVKCEKCGWQGQGKETSVYETFRDGAEYCCPNSCDHVMAFVLFPTHEEMLNDPRVDAADRKLAIIRETRWQRFEQEKLKTAEQLPTIEPPPKVLIWDFTEDSGERFVVIRNDADEIWRELSWFENYPRFAEIAQILRDKYGPGLKDLVPTDASGLDLYGDRLGSPRVIDGVREALANSMEIKF